MDTSQRNLPHQNPIPQFSGADISKGNTQKPEPKKRHIFLWVATGCCVSFVLIALVVILLGLRYSDNLMGWLSDLQGQIENATSGSNITKSTFKNITDLTSSKEKNTLESAVMAKDVDQASGDPVEATDVFTSNDEKYYLVTKILNPDSLDVNVRWYKDGKFVTEGGEKDLKKSSNITFFLDVSQNATMARVGDYKAEVYFDTQRVKTITFRVTTP